MCVISHSFVCTLSFAVAARYQILLLVMVYLLLLLFYLCSFPNIEYIRNKFLYSWKKNITCVACYLFPFLYVYHGENENETKKSHQIDISFFESNFPCYYAHSTRKALRQCSLAFRSVSPPPSFATKPFSIRHHIHLLNHSPTNTPTKYAHLNCELFYKFHICVHNIWINSKE